ncbi:hypothetical protein SAY86_027421 [Trapa natans]|uniref:Uncharacterized protein n=1 Tax=Trapa natans TaxID=22666 RepID=A0AAN7KLE3_TRANT|nr:hypothetical protein SAY86_027421 [Trapa natans]
MIVAICPFFLRKLLSYSLDSSVFACRLLKPGGVYMLITYGDPNARMPHLDPLAYNWQIILYIIPRPGFCKANGSGSSVRSPLEPIPLTEKGMLPLDYTMEDPDSHFIYVCKKKDETAVDSVLPYPLNADFL